MEAWEAIAKWVAGSGALFSGEMCVVKSTLGYVVGAREGYSMCMREVIEIFGELDVAAKFAAKRFPKEAQQMVDSERYQNESRKRYFAEEAKRANAFNVFSSRMMAAMQAAMAKAKITAKVWVEPAQKQSAYGDYTGYSVWAMNPDMARRAAEWICSWERKEYEKAGGKYGGCTYDAQRCYRAELEEEGSSVDNKPARAFANLRYYSIGD